MYGLCYCRMHSTRIVENLELTGKTSSCEHVLRSCLMWPVFLVWMLTFLVFSAGSAWPKSKICCSLIGWNIPKSFCHLHYWLGILALFTHIWQCYCVAVEWCIVIYSCDVPVMSRLFELVWDFGSIHVLRLFQVDVESAPSRLPFWLGMHALPSIRQKGCVAHAQCTLLLQVWGTDADRLQPHSGEPVIPC